MTDLRFVGLPESFRRIHSTQITVWWRDYGLRKTGPYCNFLLREPLGSIKVGGCLPPDNATIDVPMLKLERGYMGYVMSPADERSAKLIAEWTKRHEHTTREQFDWYPFGDKRA